MTYPLNCPHCNEDLDGGDIFEALLAHYKNEPQALEAASHHGWTKEKPRRFSYIIAVYDMGLDETTHYECPKCKKTIDLNG